MDTSLERIRAKIAELEAKIADLRIAEREIRALEKLPSRKTRPAPGPKPKPKPKPKRKRKPEASNQAEARQTIGSAIADVLGQQGALSAAEIAEHIRATGRDLCENPVGNLDSLPLVDLAQTFDQGLVTGISREFALDDAFIIAQRIDDIHSQHKIIELGRGRAGRRDSHIRHWR